MSSVPEKEPEKFDHMTDVANLLSTANGPEPKNRGHDVKFLDAQQSASFKFVLPCRVIISGPSLCGKSQLILDIFKNYDRFFSEKFDYVIYYYPEQDGLIEARQAYIRQLKEYVPDLVTVEGLPSTSRIARLDGTKAIILDDLFQQLADHQDFVNLCTAGSHHANISFFLTTQNIYWPGRHRVTIMRQCSDLILFPGILDKSILYTLGRQLFENRHFLVHCFDWLKKYFKKQYLRVLWIDLNVLNYDIEDNMRVRGNFIDRNPMILFEND